jgi:hypothetical protein
MEITCTARVLSSEPALPPIPDRVTQQEVQATFAPGFKRSVSEENALNTGVSIEVNCKLQVGNQSETITVLADAAVGETANGDVGFRPADC